MFALTAATICVPPITLKQKLHCQCKQNVFETRVRMDIHMYICMDLFLITCTRYSGSADRPVIVEIREIGFVSTFRPFEVAALKSKLFVYLSN